MITVYQRAEWCVHKAHTIILKYDYHRQNLCILSKRTETDSGDTQTLAMPRIAQHIEYKQHKL